MTAATVRVGCKVNLGLRITGVRANGYHELDSLFLPLSEPCDELDFQSDTGVGISVECALPDLNPAHNTLTKAYAAFARRVPDVPPVHVRLRKGIPHGAGLGGGSADAAAVLRWCNAHAATPLSEATLAEIALEVGADVPFFLHPVPARVQGIGERITPCPSPWHGWTLILLCPPVPVSTPWAYAAWDAAHDQKKLPQSATHGLTSPGLEAKEKCSCTAWLLNDFEAVVFRVHPELGRLKEVLLQRGAAAAVMSGSGSSLAGLFRHEGAAFDAARQLAQQLGRDVRLFVAKL